MGLLEAPDDVKLKILEVSDPQGIRACRLVCRTFYNLIVSSPHIRYILALDTLGYTLPSVPRPDLTFHQKIEFLERHRRNWLFSGNCQPVEYVVQLEDADNFYRYDGGVYTHPLYSALYSDDIVGLRFYQLPSPNLGLELREWCIPNLGLLAQSFAIDTVQDLLVLVELNDPARSWSEGCSIHLRTMSDNSQHPKAAVPFLMAEFTESERDLEGTLAIGKFQIDVVGNMLAILFRSSALHTFSWVIVWDWNRGVEVTRISTCTRFNLSSFTLLSQNKLLLPRLSKSYYAQKDVPGDTFGSLDVYIFDPQSSISTPPRMVASFDLPKIERRSCQSELRIENHRCPKGAYADPRPKVFDLAMQDRLIAVRVQLRRFPAGSFGRIFQTGFIYVPANVLLHPQVYTQIPDKMHGVTVDHEHITKVPWVAWAHLTFWSQSDGSCLSPATSVYGQRAVEFPTWGRDDGSEQTGITREMRLFDFNPSRVRWARSDKETKGSGIISRAATTPIHDESRGLAGGEKLCEASAECVKRVLQVPSGPWWSTFQQVIMDEEHVIVQKLERPHESHMLGKLSLQVYTI